MESFLFFLALLCVSVPASSSPSDRCASDEECRDITTCGEKRFFVQKNQVEIGKLKVCGTEAGTRFFCCKNLNSLPQPLDYIDNTVENTMKFHKNMNLINHRKCGKADSKRIIGGSIAKVGSMPWMALLYYEPTNNDLMANFACGGSLISPRYVLTAAHCLNVTNYKLFQTRKFVRLGEHTISTDLDCDNQDKLTECNTDSPPTQDIAIEKMIAHGNDDSKLRKSDIALLRLASEVNLENVKFIKTICLPLKFNHTVDAFLHEEDTPFLTVAGWGISEGSRRGMSDVLRFAKVPYLTNEQAREKIDHLVKSKMIRRIETSDTTMFAGGHNKTDACGGDSGGPLTYIAENDDGINKVFQQAIVASGVSCNIDIVAPGLYTRVLPFIGWILDNMEN